MSFVEEFKKLNWSELSRRLYAKSERDVELACSRAGRGTLDDFLALVSPAADRILEPLAQYAKELTAKRFGKTVQLYIPMYLSNECTNICTYCGFSFGNEVKRLTLSPRQIEKEVEAIKRHGFEHILLLTGESPKDVGVDYLERALLQISPSFAQVSLEVQPLEQDEYARLQRAGLYSVLVYQESYHRERYRAYHLKGKKSNFDHRLDTPDRVGGAGIHKIGVGALLGLEDWRVESACVALHLEYLKRRYWKTRFSISFPRIRPAEGAIEPHSIVTDRNLVQLIAAYRIFDENLELSLSTRESAHFRDNILGIGITSMSAGSRTDPGGYASDEHALKQFEIDDNRTPAEVAKAISGRGYEPVWKDWDTSFALSGAA